MNKLKLNFQMIYNQWIQCTEDNYYQTDNDIVFIPPIDDGDEYLYYGSRRNCPYGWNILVDYNAFFITVKFPTINEN